jgi:formate dehydrogenase subunit gamma
MALQSYMENLGTVLRIIAAKQTLPGALLPILHDIQEELGYIPPESVSLIAKALNLSRAEVHGVITYYHHFRQTPPGRHVVRVCCAEACQAVGGEALADHARARLEGSDLTLEPVYCLGLCAIGPVLQIDETTLHARVTPEKFDTLMHALEEDQ